MELSKKHFEASSSFFLVYIEIIILLSCFEMQNRNVLGLATASPVVRGNDTDQEALLQFKAKITGDQLKIMEFWNRSIHFCQWPGVTCGRKHQRVTKLELQSLKLLGSLSPYIGNLSFLRVLCLPDNNFYNQIPREIGRLRRLEMLELANNSISGEIPSDLSLCSKLKVVDLESSQLTGEIPASLGLLSNLNYLGFRNNSLRGSIPPSLGNLSSLETLDLTNNGLTGIIPEALGHLTNLSYLGIEVNAISGIVPDSVFNLSNIRVFDISENNIQGTLPSNLGISMPYVEFFSIGDNQISGEIPASLGLLSNLNYLYFSNNSLRGSIPPSLGNLSSLETLALALNGLTGIIPEALGGLKDLLYLHIGGNAISGTVPVSIFNLSNIRSFDIGVNKIQGTLPSDLEITMPYVEFFSIGDNQINGQIPVSISNASNLNILQLAENKLSGYVPSLEKLDKLSRLILGVNHLGHGREGDLNFLCTLVNNTKLEYLTTGGNNFGGVLPKCISNFSNTLLGLGMEGNKISGRISSGIGNLFNLETLYLSENQLSGSIPFDIGRLQKLNIFYAHNNFLSGTIPHSIGNLTELTKLGLESNNLQGSLPSSLGNCQNLLEMRLSHNNLTGPIPPEVLELQSLSIVLNLSSNYFTGELPNEVEKLKNLGGFDVSHNRLSGLLPSNLGSCVSLEKLFLNDNLLEGPIPPALRSLRGLVEFDVSDNNLSGEVPEFLVSFGALKYLNLSFNDFEGHIPSEGVFKNASATFVEGNNKLCGGIPELQLSRCNLKMSSNTSRKLKIAIVVVTLGVTLVFTCILILWLRKKNEQQPIATSAENLLLQLSYKSILKATDGFSTQNLVGSGSFGSVYKGILEVSGAVIAVKVLNLLNHGAPRSFLVECEALKNIRHRHLVKVVTAISSVDYQGNDFKALVYEFMENGSLENWLHPSIDENEMETMRNLNFFQRVNVAIDIAHALEYLHHRCETSIIHCDLKPSNILLDDEMIGHISDFGLAKILSIEKLHDSANQSSTLGLRGTIGYVPPEYGMGSELSTKGDVYSYGILLLEMFTGKRPTHDMFKEGFSIHNFVMTALPDRVVEIIDPVLLQERVIHGAISDNSLERDNLQNGSHLQCLSSIFEIGLTCSAESPSKRIDMSVVVTKLCSIREKLHPSLLHHEIRT